MKLEEAITKRIYDLCEERKISPNKLASMAGLPPATLRCIFTGAVKTPVRAHCWTYVRRWRSRCTTFSMILFFKRKS